MIDYSRYYRAFAEMKDTLDGDYAHDYLTSAMADADNGNDELSGDAYNRVIDMEWVEMIEGKLPYIEKAIDEQRKFIEEHKEVDRIDKVKQVGKDAVQHLTQHANLIMAIEDDGSVIPERLLNTHREDSFATYENRFLHTLIFKCIAFVEARFRALQDAPNDSSSKIHMDREIRVDNQQFGFNLDHHAERHERNKVDRDEDLSGLSDYERIGRIRMKLDDFVGTDLMKALKGCIAVKSPINKTNCIKQDPAFKQCYDLWVFIEGYRKTGYVLEKNVFEGKMPDDVQKDLYDVMAFQHFVATISTNKALRDKLHEEYVAENKRRELEANKPEEEVARYIEEKIYEAKREEMALRLKEVREREVIISKLTAELEQAKEQIRIRDIKIKELESVVNALKKELEQAREELRQAQVRIMELEKEVEELKAHIAELEAKIAQLEATIRELEAQIAAHLATIAALNERISELEATITKLNEEIEQLRATIAEQAQTIAEHEQTIASQASQIEQLNTNVAQLQANNNALITENDSLKSTVENQEKTISEQGAELESKASMLSTANEQINNLSSQLSTAQDDLSSLRHRYENHQSEVDGLNAVISEQNAEKDELNHQIRVHLNMLSAKEAIINTLNEDKDKLKQQMIDSDNSFLKNKAETDAIRDKFAAVESENVALNNTLRTHVANIASRDKKIAELQSVVDNANTAHEEALSQLTASYEAKLEAMRSDYESKLALKEQEKLSACTFTDEQKYSVRLNAEKRAIQADYDKKLREAKKKAKAYVKKAKVLIDYKPEKLLELDDTKDYT